MMILLYNYEFHNKNEKSNFETFVTTEKSKTKFDNNKKKIKT